MRISWRSDWRLVIVRTHDPDGERGKGMIRLGRSVPRYMSVRVHWLMLHPDPTTQADFSDQVVANTTDIDPGHQCYKLDALEDVSAGQNGTIQLEYWAEFEGENNGKNQSFFACADIVRTTPIVEDACETFSTKGSC